ncbi:anaerobic glycerol-3-phosphate dehydrogenase subunit C, partial [Bacteroidota bacterium]
RHVDEINLVLSNGKLFNARNIPLSEIPKLGNFHQLYYEKTKELLEEYSSEIIESRPRTTKNVSGYHVWNVLTHTHLNLASMLVGSEGTLGVFTDAKLKVIPENSHRGIISFYFTDIVKMGMAVKHLRILRASAVEFVDQSFIKLALTFRPELKSFLPGHVKYLMYVEFESDDENHIEELFQRSKSIIADQEKLAEVGSYSTDENEIENIFQLRKAATVILNKVQGEEKPVPFIEDAAIHPDIFPEFLIDLSELLENFSFTYAMFGHAGDGNLHLRPLLNFKDAESYNSADELMDKFVELVRKYDGSLSGEHGDGRLRTPFIDQQYPKLIPLFEELKNLFDPIGIMNPDIIVSKKNYKWNDNLRLSPDYSYTETNSRLDTEKWRMEIEKCHGCGTCREYCPVFVATGKEESTARAKANILRGIISGKISVNEIDSDHFYEIMNHCLNCGQCLTDCPTAVDIPGMAVLAKEKLHQKRPYSRSEFLLHRGKVLSRIASTFSIISNLVLNLFFVRALMQYAVGIHINRNFPSFAKPKKTKSISGGKNKVVLWSGCAAQYNDPDGELISSIQILNKLGCEVIQPDWKCCNIAKLSYGNLNGAQDDIDFNSAVLMPYIDKNIPIIFTSASCGYAFMHEYSTFFPERADLKKIADAGSDIHDFLGRIFSSGEYENSFKGINKRIVYHAPCHLKTQMNKYGFVDLLKHIPGIKLVNINDSCCGIAGTFGMKKENFDLSMEIGSNLFDEILNASPDVVLSGCVTCQVQINQGTGLEVIHPVALFNESFQPN